MSVGLCLLTSITATTDAAACCGCGCSSRAWASGPRSRSFTIVVQSAVPFDKLGVATCNLTFFRQIGGSVGLAIVGTHLRPGPGGLRSCRRSSQQGIPQDLAGQLARFAGGGGGGEVGQVGQTCAPRSRRRCPRMLQPFLDQIVNGVFDAFSHGGRGRVLGGHGGGARGALVVALFLPEVPLRGMVRRGAPGVAGAPGHGGGGEPEVEIIAPGI